MMRIAIVALLLAAPGAARQDRQLIISAQIIQCKTGADKKSLPAGKLDAIAKALAEQTTCNQFEITATGSVRTEDGVLAKVALGGPMNLALSFKATIGGAITLSDLTLTTEEEREFVTTTATSTVKEKRWATRVLLATRCSSADEEPMLIGVVGMTDGALAVVVRITSK
jgi:hypothetical protein